MYEAQKTYHTCKLLCPFAVYCQTQTNFPPSCTTKSRFRQLFSLQHNLPTSLTEPNINGKEQGFSRHLAKRKSNHKPMAVGLTFNAGTSYNLKSSVIVPTTTQIFPEKSPFAFIFLT